MANVIYHKLKIVRGGERCLLVTESDRPEAVKDIGLLYHAEDARRLVACWNACEGISTEYLEGEPCFQDALMDLDEESEKAEKLTQALQHLLNWRGTGSPEEERAVGQAELLLREVMGGQP